MTQGMLNRAPLLIMLLTVGCGAPPPPATPEPPPPTDTESPAPGPVSSTDVVGVPERSAEDRALDAGRHPEEILSFFEIGPGQRVAELAAGGGYTAELLARSVGPSGAVYAVNSPFLLERFAEQPWSERLRKPVMKNVVRVDRSFDDPLPSAATELDAVLCVLFYHDFFWQNVDRAAMNQAVFKALKPGGIYGIVDHAARAGEGATVVKSLHRIEEKIVREEIEAAGFQLAAEGSFLRNPNDAGDWNAAPSAAGSRRGTSDRFVLKYVKPVE